MDYKRTTRIGVISAALIVSYAFCSGRVAGQETFSTLEKKVIQYESNTNNVASEYISHPRN